MQFEIMDELIVLSEGVSVAKKLCLVSWHGREPVFDLRAWRIGSGKGVPLPLKGITLTAEELQTLGNFLASNAGLTFKKDERDG